MAGMTRFHDPHTCPDCGAALADGLTRCPACLLPLTGELAARLGTTLRHADTLLEQLRRLRTASPVPGDLPTYPAVPAGPVSAPRPRRRGLRPTSVPMILLGLGAVCLLVAAVIFLAVAWSSLGIGGRTAVLVGLTALAVAASRWLGARGLWVGAESLTVVALGLLMVDLAGAAEAGWVGDPVGGLDALWYGAALAVAAMLLMAGRTRLVAPQLAVVAGSLVAVVDLGRVVAGPDHPVAVLGVLVGAALAHLGVRLGQRVLPWAALVTAAWSWLALVGLAIDDALARPRLRVMWLEEGSGWWLLLGGLLLLLPSLTRRGQRVVAAGLAGAGALLTGALALPVVDEGPTRVVVVSLVALCAWAGVAAAVRGRWALVPLPSLALAATPVLVAGTWLLAVATARSLTVGSAFGETAGVRLAPTYADGPHPLLLVPVVLTLHLALAAVRPQVRRRLARSAGVATLLGAEASLALHAVPLWAVLAPLLLGAAAACAVAVARPTLGLRASAGALCLAAAGSLVALPSATLATVALAVLVAVAGAQLATRDEQARALGGLVLPLAVAGLVWSGGEVAAVAWEVRSLLAVGLVGLLALVRPRLELELAGVVAAVAAGVAGVGGAPDPATWLAIHLTVAGALVCASALVHPTRRPAGWLGGLLLAAATWVRLADLGVSEPEPYTLPTAAVLVLLGLLRLRRDAAADTMTSLVPGLSLATVPSLLWALADPLSARAALLGAACLVLVLAGAAFRWSAPLVVGAGVGGVLVLWELWPYVLETPQWVVIGTAGTLLTVAGITWERRLRELRRAAAYVGALR